MDTPERVVDAHRVVRDGTAAMLATREPAAMRPLLRQLVDVLPGHFADEERPGGWFERIRRHNPGAVVDALVLEHQDLEATAALLCDAEAGWEPSGWVGEVHAFARRLQEHERKETRLGSGHD